jgi:elongation factor Ts
MSEITAKLVNELRAKTGLGMMECKRALTETAGDVDKAIEGLRKKGVKTSITARAASEGRVTAAVSADKKRGVIVEVNCNTDFTAKSEPLAEIAEAAAQKLLANPEQNPAEDAQLKDQLIAAAQKTGENVQIGRTVSLSGGTIGKYLYSAAGKGKIAVLVSVSGKVDDNLILDLGVHIAAARPLALTREEIPAELVAKEREIAVEQAKATGKPQNIAEKIAEGKLNSFYAEKVLLDQEFIKPDAFKGSVAKLLASKGATLDKYIRIEVGQ